MDELWRVSGDCIGPICAAAGAGIWGFVRHRRLQEERRRNKRFTDELDAYARLEVRGDEGQLGAQVCKVVAERSTFQSVAMLSRDGDGRLLVTAHSGMDQAMCAALDGWGKAMMIVGPTLSQALGDKADRQSGGRELRSAPKEPAVRPWTRRVWVELLGREIWLVPLWTTAGRMVGAIALFKDATVKEEDLLGLESLAAKLGRTLENAALAERLLKSEKLAGLGQLAGGVAHALNNPLTAVIGFAELIAETTDHARVQEDAATILREATRMRETVQSLLDLWHPATLMEEAVSVSGLVRELATACEGKLKARGVRMVVETGEEVVEVKGSRKRLRLVMEHLLNNAAQAIGTADSNTVEAATGHFIRVTVRRDDRECR